MSSTATTAAFEEAAGMIGATASRDVALAPFTTYRLGGAAAVLARPRDLSDLAAVAAARVDTGLPVLVVGKGSNMLVADAGFPGIAVSLADFGSSAAAETIDARDADGVTFVSVRGGASLPTLARRLAAAGIVGFEWAVGIPGSVGGAVKMNAGGHGSDMAAVVRDVTTVSLPAVAGEVTGVTVPVNRLGLRFRASDVADHEVVLSATLALSRGDAGAATERISEIVRWRREHQPGGQNCGSVFVNPVPGEVSAGLLIDGLGLRGTRVGDAWVSEKHANFIQAAPGASAADVLAVIELVRSEVAEHTGYALRSEVRLVGFEPSGKVGVA